MFYLNGTTETIAAGVTHAKELIGSGTVEEWLSRHESTNYAVGEEN